MRAVNAILSVLAMMNSQHNGDIAPTFADPASPQIIVKINPEARISASWSGPLPQPTACTVPASLRLQIINQAMITSPLLAVVVEPESGVSIDMENGPLAGGDVESRTIKVTAKHDMTDVTIMFVTAATAGDGEGAPVHFLFRCTR